MTGAEWIVEKINSSDMNNINSRVDVDNVVFVERAGKKHAYVGIIPTRRGETTPIVSLDEAKGGHLYQPRVLKPFWRPRADQALLLPV